MAYDDEESDPITLKVVRWEEPDAPRPGVVMYREWQKVVDQLKARRGKWAVIFERPAMSTDELEAVVRIINNGHGPFGPKGTFQVRRRTYITDPNKPPDVNDYHQYRNKTVALYCRYLTDEQKLELDAERSRRREKRREGRR